MKLMLYGSGGTGKEVLYVANKINEVSQKWDEILFIDDTIPNGEKYGIKHYTFDYVKENFSPTEYEVCIAVGEPYLREILWNKVEMAGYNFASLIHPSVILRDRVKIGRGVVIKENALVSCDAVIEDNVCITTMSCLGHDVTIGKNSFLAAEVTMAGGSSVGMNSFLGMHASVREQTKVGNCTIIGQGACVMNDIPDGVIAMGNPARVFKKNIDNHVMK